MPELLQTAIRGERGTHPATREHRGRTSMAHTTQHTPKPQALTPKSAVPYELWEPLARDRERDTHGDRAGTVNNHPDVATIGCQRRSDFFFQ
jgi:hypothetical protein